MKKKSSVVPVPSALPRAAGLNVDALSKVFDSTATSYKFLWMLGLLDVLEENDFKPGGIPASRVVLHMLRHADDPIRRFHLSLGAQDRIARHLRELCELAASSPRTPIERLIEGNPAFESVQRELLLYVPQRCLTPFFPRINRGSERTGQRDSGRRRQVFCRVFPAVVSAGRRAIGRKEGRAVDCGVQPPLAGVFPAECGNYSRLGVLALGGVS